MPHVPVAVAAPDAQRGADSMGAALGRRASLYPGGDHARNAGIGRCRTAPLVGGPAARVGGRSGPVAPLAARAGVAAGRRGRKFSAYFAPRGLFLMKYALY